jgi:hypothetical protein
MYSVSRVEQIHYYKNRKRPDSDAKTASTSGQGCQIWTGLPDFSWYNIPKRPQNMPNGHETYAPDGCKIFQMGTKYQHCIIQGPQKFTQFGIFGLKYTNHLATLPVDARRVI